MNDTTTDIKEFSTEKAHNYEKEYSEKGFWEKLKHEATRAGATVVYTALQLYYVMVSGRVSLGDKAFIIGVLGYLILPTDLIPDLLPTIGYADDLTALMAVLQRISGNIDDTIRQQALSKTRELLGDENLETYDVAKLLNSNKK